jgi:hypothetical protein
MEYQIILADGWICVGVFKPAREQRRCRITQQSPRPAPTRISTDVYIGESLYEAAQLFGGGN